MKFLNEKEITRWLSLAKDRPRDYALLHIALSTGFRVSDFIKITRSQVVDNDGEPVRVLRVKMKKTSKYINRPLREDCRKAIQAYLGSRRDSNPWLFVAESNNQKDGQQHIDRSTAFRIYKKYLSLMYPASELQGQGCHISRRSVAKIISDKTGRIEPAMEFLGHSSPISTMHYIDRDEYKKQADSAVIELQY